MKKIEEVSQIQLMKRVIDMSSHQKIKTFVSFQKLEQNPLGEKSPHAAIKQSNEINS
jgi:hypothetical protein